MRDVSDYYEDFHAERGKYGTVEIKERIDFIAREVGVNHDVIELGCRYGSLLSFFLKGNRVTGVDVDREALLKCSETFHIKTQVADLNKTLPFPDGSFDVVVMSEVLEHLPYPEVSLSEANRILRVGGKFVGSVPNGARLQNRLDFLMTGVVDQDRSHLRFFSVETLRVTLERQFDQVEIVPVAGRFARLSGRLLANYLLFTCRRLV
jgi:SAM-dependent methyltransferase